MNVVIPAYVYAYIYLNVCVEMLRVLCCLWVLHPPIQTKHGAKVLVDIMVALGLFGMIRKRKTTLFTV